MTQPLFRLELENQSAVNAMHAIMDEYARARKGACHRGPRVMLAEQVAALLKEHVNDAG